MPARSSQGFANAQTSSGPALKRFRKPVIGFDELCDKDAVEELALPLTENRGGFDPLCAPANKVFTTEGDCADFMREVVGILYRVGAVGVKPTAGDRYYYSHIDQPVMEMADINHGSRVRVHSMLHRSLGMEGR
jgi:hypothetical protein